MTIVDTPSKGHGSTAERARQVWHPDMSGAELARQMGVPERTGSYWARKLRTETGNTATLPTTDKPATGPATAPATAKRDGSRQPARRGKTPPPLVTGTIVAVAVVAAVAAVVSYSHIRDLAVSAGAGWRADILPLSLDGLVAACTFALVVDRKRGSKFGHPLAWAGIAVGLVGSVAANVLAVVPGLADPQVVAAVLAWFPPVALAVSAHLLVRTLADR
jgi:Protein of unknown function (DUF2637)